MATVSRAIGHSKQQYSCAMCGAEKWQWPSQVHKHFFCSHQCHYLWMAGRPSPKKGRVSLGRKACAGCSLEIVAPKYVLRRRRYCSRACFGRHTRGHRHPGWKGGHALARTGLTPEYRAWRIAVIKRDGGRCRWCLNEGHLTYRSLEVHHIVPVARAPALSMVTENAITLCRRHHIMTKGREEERAEFLAGLICAALLAPPVANRKRVGLTAAEIERLYHSNGMSTAQIAATVGAHPTAIQRIMKQSGIPRRNSRESAVLARTRGARNDIGR